LLLRTLRLNCLTRAYAPLWAALFDLAWTGEQWAVAREGLAPLGNANTLTPEWNAGTPLRTERERRSALVEIDALVAVWMGITIDELLAMYLGRFPQLVDYEATTYFDSAGRKLVDDHNAFGRGQTKEHYPQLMAHLDDPERYAPPEGYSPPFYKTDREAEYRQAHAAFSLRIRGERFGNGVET
jgi:hypothetical protein